MLPATQAGTGRWTVMVRNTEPSALREAHGPCTSRFSSVEGRNSATLTAKGCPDTVAKIMFAGWCGERDKKTGRGDRTSSLWRRGPAVQAAEEGTRLSSPGAAHR